MTEPERRALVRQRYGGRCGYCGVHENEAGSELEIDHFQPRSSGGDDELDNLVYCCPTCNRLKGDFWPTPAATLWLLNPGRDDMARHVYEESDGSVIALTAIGAFHVARLRLNRPPLQALRRSRRETLRLRERLAEAEVEQVRLRDQLAALEQDLKEVLAQLTRLIEP